MHGMTILYGLFARDAEEMDAARQGQLNIQRPNAESLYPAYLWQTMTQTQREEWIEDEAKRYDRFNRLFSITSLPVSYNGTSGQFDVVPSQCNMLHDDNEKALLSYVWQGLDQARMNQYSICGWRIKEDIWPRLVNRSVALGVTIPPWAKPNLTRRYLDVELHDIAHIYSCGVWGRRRPLPAIHYALRFWLGRSFVPEEDVQLRAETNTALDLVEEATCSYVVGMAEVMNNYLK